jgi:drug/metabolite transporter (DMT)-like permease
LPFVLITIAEQDVPSSLAATLTAPVPLFAILFAAAMLHERITAAKSVGVVIGMIGVAVLMGFDPSQIGQTDLKPQLLLVGACVSYGYSGVYARKYVTGMRPMVPAFIEVASAMLIVAVGAVLFENPVGLIGSLPADGLFAVLWLGVFGSGLAYLAFFRLIGTWGATRTTSVAYLLPVWGVALGFVVLSEPIQPGLVLGTALVIAGIAFVNLDRATVVGTTARVRSRLGRPADAGVPDAVIPPR